MESSDESMVIVPSSTPTMTPAFSPLALGASVVAAVDAVPG